ALPSFWARSGASRVAARRRSAIRCPPRRHRGAVARIVGTVRNSSYGRIDPFTIYGKGRSREAIFLLALAGDVPRAHRAQSQRPRAGGGYRGQSDEGRATRGEVPRGQSANGSAGAGRRRRAG